MINILKKLIRTIVLLTVVFVILWRYVPNGRLWLAVLFAIVCMYCFLKWHRLHKKQVQLKDYQLAGQHYQVSENSIDKLCKCLTASSRSQMTVGVYVLRNLNSKKVYVGQSVNIYRRVKQHVTGHGNPDVYFDLRTGDTFSVTLVLIARTRYTRLNDLERELITLHNAYYSGYNKTRGNQ